MRQGGLSRAALPLTQAGLSRAALPLTRGRSAAKKQYPGIIFPPAAQANLFSNLK